MKTNRLVFLTGAMAVALAVSLFTGCTTTKMAQQTESLLASAGFKAIPVTTPQQQRMLSSLPSGAISPTTQKGQVYFVYPDKAHKTLYVGSQAQYLAYKQKAAEQNRETQDWDSVGVSF